MRRCLMMSAMGLLAMALLSSSCHETTGTTGSAITPQTATLMARGKTIYQTNCIACHNTDPRKAGSLGPEVVGASRALIEARVLRAEYPPGYKPKRATKAMMALPHLQPEVEALHAYLNSF